MQDVTAELAKKIDQKTQDDRQIAGETRLDRCYGQIGISAVAAAARYQGGVKNPAYAPTSDKWRDRIAESGA